MFIETPLCLSMLAGGPTSGIGMKRVGSKTWLPQMEGEGDGEPGAFSSCTNNLLGFSVRSNHAASLSFYPRLLALRAYVQASAAFCNAIYI